ncbi:MAG: potassium transporter Kup [Limisphaerales bacterium]
MTDRPNPDGTSHPRQNPNDAPSRPTLSPGVQTATSPETVPSHGEPTGRWHLAGLTLAALGVVYGDIGTSPLYTLKECFDGHHGVAVTPSNIVGVVSLLIWSLILIVAVKYVGLILMADNRGEGGIFALLSLAFPERGRPGEKPLRARVMIALGLFGAVMLYGDGMITPAISVLGAVEGLTVLQPRLESWVVPLSSIILAGLFLVQKAGTAAVGRVFGIVMILWFTALAALGVPQLVRHPEILSALNPLHGLGFLLAGGWTVFPVLGSVVLVITGGEALYADMGHFGRRPIRIAWFGLVFPALILNYLGQGALLLHNPGAAGNPFFNLGPKWMLVPMIGLATAAAIIASQALISGAFSLTMQGMQLGYIPRMAIEHTSERERGQVYMPQVNAALAVACLGLVMGFQTSSRLASAYGIAVTLTMTITTLLFLVAARKCWNWHGTRILAVGVPLLALEISFLGANALKILHGGWFPLVIGIVLYATMRTWKQGREILGRKILSVAVPIQTLIQSVQRREPTRVAGTAVYLSGNADGTPLALLHNLKLNKVLHERVIFLTLQGVEAARVPDAERVDIESLPEGFWRVRARFGFFEEPDIQKVLDLCAHQGLSIRIMETAFLLSRETIVPSAPSQFPRWRQILFGILSRNAQSATAFFRLPASRVVELGMQMEL